MSAIEISAATISVTTPNAMHDAFGDARNRTIEQSITMKSGRRGMK
jgi:hypothetical protein